jgi:hypothetical protein
MRACTCVARLCGSRRDRALAAWGRGDGQTCARARGVTPAKTPCAATGPQVLRTLDGPLGEAALGAGAARVLTALPRAVGAVAARALDGTTRRGRRHHGAPAVPRRAALRPRVGRTRWPPAVAETTPERSVRADVWRGLLLAGRGLPVEAWRTPRASAPHLGDAGGADVLSGQGTPPQVPHDLRLVCPAPMAWTARITACDTVDSGPGRLEARRVPTRLALGGDRDGPGLAQGCPVERRVTRTQSGTPRADGGYGVTRLSPERARPAGWWRRGRQPWHLAHTVQGGRAVTCAEERSHVRWGSLPQVMAACRTTAIGVRPWAGETRLAAACRRFAAQPWSAFALIGIRPDN